MTDSCGYAGYVAWLCGVAWIQQAAPHGPHAGSGCAGGITKGQLQCVASLSCLWYTAVLFEFSVVFCGLSCAITVLLRMQQTHTKYGCAL
jgi:hypothetical protein